MDILDFIQGFSCSNDPKIKAVYDAISINGFKSVKLDFNLWLEFWEEDDLRKTINRFPTEIETKNYIISLVKDDLIIYIVIHLRSEKFSKTNDMKKQDFIIVSEILKYLNIVCDTSYRATTKKHQKFILRRIKDGYSLVDFRTVIDKKAKEWIGTPQAIYLRPETLFSPKFEKYLNQKEKISPFKKQSQIANLNEQLKAAKRKASSI